MNNPFLNIPSWMTAMYPNTCLIGMKNGVRSLVMSTCTSDIAPAQVIPVLAEHYNTDEKVKALLSGGSFAKLGADPKKIAYYPAYSGYHGNCYFRSALDLNRDMSSQCSLDQFVYIWLGDGKWCVSDTRQGKLAPVAASELPAVPDGIELWTVAANLKQLHPYKKLKTVIAK
jgi:hypothetical protein